MPNSPQQEEVNLRSFKCQQGDPGLLPPVRTNAADSSKTDGRTENLINQSIYRHKSGQALIVSVSQTMDQLAATWRPKALQRKMNATLGRWFTRQTDQQSNTNQNTALDQLRLSVCLFSRLIIVRTGWNPAAEELATVLPVSWARVHVGRQAVETAR